VLRYRDHAGGLTQKSVRALRNLPKLGTITKVRGYRFWGKYGLEEAVMVYGENGTARYEGVLWGYGGTGPSGLVQLLRKIGVDGHFAERVAFYTPRRDNVGTDWTLTNITWVDYFHGNRHPNEMVCQQFSEWTFSRPS
jgi:hypothetical protein